MPILVRLRKRGSLHRRPTFRRTTRFSREMISDGVRITEGRGTLRSRISVEFQWSAVFQWARSLDGEFVSTMTTRNDVSRITENVLRAFAASDSAQNSELWYPIPSR